MSDMIKRDYQNWTGDGSDSDTLPTPTVEQEVSFANEAELHEETVDIFPTFDGASEIDEASKLFYLYFCIADLSVELHSRGRSVAQFQVIFYRAFMAIKSKVLKIFTYL